MQGQTHYQCSLGLLSQTYTAETSNEVAGHWGPAKGQGTVVKGVLRHGTDTVSQQTVGHVLLPGKH